MAFEMTLWLDVTLLASVCALQNVFFTGLVFHEWLGLAMVAMVFAQLMLSWSWIASQSRSPCPRRHVQLNSPAQDGFARRLPSSTGLVECRYIAPPAVI